MNTTPNLAPWVNIAVGIMTIISPYVLATSSDANKWALVIGGIVIGIVAIIELAVYPRETKMGYWPVINILAGIWLFISTTFANGNAGMIWSDVILGVTAIVSAAVALGYERVHAGPTQTVNNARM